MNIGNINIDNPLFLAPMAGITDHPFRTICRDMGAGVVYTEFVSANGIIRENLKTLELMKFAESERPIGIQIFGEDPDIVGRSAKMVYNLFKPDIIDINYGCPVPKVTKRGAGSAALKNLSLMEEITQSVVESVPQIPVTVKMRSGWNGDAFVSTEAGVKLEKVGIAAITLHPRTTKQQFTGLSNWSHIKELKSAVSIPVIGNGDVKTVDDYFRMKEETNCDAVMIGRGALGNPWIFKNIKEKEDGKEIKILTLLEKTDICIQHFQLLKEDKNDITCVNLAKKHLSYYLRGFEGAAKWRKNIMKAKHPFDIIKTLKELKNISY